MAETSALNRVPPNQHKAPPTMTRPTPALRLLAVAATLIATGSQAWGQTNYFWNGGDITANPANGGSGNWSTPNAWRTVTDTGSEGTWAAGAGGTNNGFLVGEAGTITLGTSGSANFTGSSLTVNTTGYTITSTSSSRNLVLSGPLTLANNVALTLDQNNTNAIWGFGSISFGSGASLVIQGGATTNNANRVNLTSASTIADGSITLAGNGTGVTGFVSTVSTGSGGVTLNTNISNSSSTSATMLGATSGNLLSFGGVLSGSANLQISAGQAGGAGTVLLGNVSTFTGNTYLNGATNGVTRIGIDNALPSGTTVFFGQSAGGGTADTGGSLDLNGFNLTIGALESASSTRGVSNNTASLSTLTIGKASGTNTFGGVIGTVTNNNLTTQSNNIAVVKTGGNTQIFGGANTYTGGTTVQAGTLRVANTTGSGTGTGAVVVNNTASLDGTGAIAGVVTVQSGGTIRAGDGNAGTLTLNGGLITQSGSTVGVRVTDGSTGGAANSGASTLGTVPNPTSNSFIDLLAASAASIDLVAGTRIQIDGTGANFTLNQAYSYQVARVGFDASTLTITDQSLFSTVGFQATGFSVSGNASGAVYLNFTPVPEPATVLAIGAAGLGLAGWVRRRRMPATV